MGIVTKLNPLGGPASLVTLTINPSPASATVVLTASGYTQSGKSITVPPGTSVSYTVSATNYTTKTGTQVVNSSMTLNVTLVYTPYSPNEVIQTGAGTFSVLVNGAYQLIICGGGGGGSNGFNAAGVAHNSKGGNGGLFNGEIWLTSGSYTSAVGAGGAHSSGANVYQVFTGKTGGTSTLKNSGGTALVSCTGGTGGVNGGYVGTTKNGTNGTASYGNATTKNVTTGAGYSTYGIGGNGKHNGSAGYFQLKYLRSTW